MNNVSIHPSSLEGIKRLAKTLKRDNNTTHLRALDEAAHAAGYQNFQHARNQLANSQRERPRAGARHDVFLTAYWRDEEGLSGRETLRLEFTKPLNAIVKPRQLPGYLRHFRWDADDHLETTPDIRDQLTARNLVNRAARTLAFLETTGLVPGSRRGQHAVAHRAHGMPNHDHQSTWIDTDSNFELLVDEPYGRFSVESQVALMLDDRAEWLRPRGLYIADTRWPGLYSPGHAHMFLISDDQPRLAEITRQLDALHFDAPDQTWGGESAAYAPSFISPARRTSGKVKRARAKPVQGGEIRNGATPYQMTPFSSVSWRPVQRMSFASHRKAGALLQALLGLPKQSNRIHEGLGTIRCELDEWMQREFTPGEVSDEDQQNCYYGRLSEATLPPPMKPADAAERVRAIVASGYPDCTPVRAVLRRLATAQKALATAAVLERVAQPYQATRGHRSL